MLAALQDAAGPMTPKEIQVAAELSSRNATDILLSKMVKLPRSSGPDLVGTAYPRTDNMIPRSRPSLTSRWSSGC